MKILKNSFLILFISCIAQYSQGQKELAIDAANSLKEAKANMQHVLKTIKNIYKEDQLFLENLEKAQKAWETLQKAELELKYPTSKQDQFGSILPICFAYYKADLINQRTNQLRYWIKGTIEGDVCTGTLRIVEEITEDNHHQFSITKNKTISIQEKEKLKYRIFVYQNANENSTPILLFGNIKEDINNNPYACSLGAFKSTKDTSDINLTFLDVEGDFIKAELRVKNEESQVVYMNKKWFKILK